MAAITVKDLAELVGALDGRVAALEQYVASNDGRITNLEGRARTAFQSLRADAERERWRTKYRKTR